MKRALPKLTPAQRVTHWEAEVRRAKVAVDLQRAALRLQQQALRRARDNLRRAKEALEHLH